MAGSKYLIIRNRINELKMTLNIPRNIREMKDLLDEPSLWSHMERKPRSVRRKELILWYLKNKEVCKYYNSYGFDIKAFRDKSEYLPYRQFRIERYEEDMPNDYLYNNRISLLRDKVLFAAFFGNRLGEKYLVKTIGVLYPDSAIYDYEKKDYTNSESFFSTKDNLFIKKINGECGEGCYTWDKSDDFHGLIDQCKGSTYIIQHRLAQHEEVNRINPSCINTIRIITIVNKKTKKPEVFGHYMRVGCNAINDNRATGGVGVGISTDGRMMKYGVGHHKVETSHSVTGFVYDRTLVPYWKQICELVVRAHQAIPEVVTIGWDVAITPDGPVLIEGNDNWEISGAQDSMGGLKDRWYQLHGR